jgi:hypothetical protein
MELDIDSVERLVEEQTILLWSSNPRAVYADYVRLLSWYWALPAEYKSGWVYDWIRALTE